MDVGEKGWMLYKGWREEKVEAESRVGVGLGRGTGSMSVEAIKGRAAFAQLLHRERQGLHGI